MTYFDEILRDIKLMQKNLMESMMDNIKDDDKPLHSDQNGQWSIREINQPNVKGFVVYGEYKTENPFDSSTPNDPALRPDRLKRPLPRPRPIPNEIQEPITDVFEDDKTIKLYAHIPGLDKDNLQLNILEGEAEIKAKNFYTTVKLPTEEINTDKIKAKCKNGVLEVTIPKKKKRNVKKKKIKIE